MTVIQFDNLTPASPVRAYRHHLQSSLTSFMVLLPIDAGVVDRTSRKSCSTILPSTINLYLYRQLLCPQVTVIVPQNLMTSTTTININPIDHREGEITARTCRMECFVRWITSLRSPCCSRERLLNWWPQKDRGERRRKSCAQKRLVKWKCSNGCKAPRAFYLTSGLFPTRS